VEAHSATQGLLILFSVCTYDRLNVIPIERRIMCL
jgi:hypothetical protein